MRLPLVIAAVGLGGCTPNYPAIEIKSLSPEWGYNGEVSEVEIVGKNFYPVVSVSGIGQADLDRDFSAWLETDPVTYVDVQLTSYTTLKAQVGEGIRTGRYGFTIESPAGERATIDDAFTVTDTRADHLFATADDNTFVAGEPVAIHLELQDPEGFVVPLDFSVDVTVEGAVHGAEAVNFDETLDEQVPLTGGVRGGLRSGKGYLTITSEEPDDVWLTVTPTDPTSVVDPFTIFLTFDAGFVSSILVDVLGGDTIVAGEDTNLHIAFLDDQQHEVKGVAGTVLLYETCPGGTLLETWEPALETHTVQVTAATGTANCAVNSIAATAIVSGAQVSGESEPLTVLAGPPTLLTVDAGPLEVRAGEDDLTVIIKMADAYGNWIQDYETEVPDVSLSDDVGGLGPSLGHQVCGPFQAGITICTAQLWESANDVSVTAVDGLLREGTSNVFDVVPGHAFALEATPALSTVVAGVDVELRIQVFDAVGNPLEIDPSTTDVPVFEDDEGNGVACTYTGELAAPLEEVHAFNCRLYVADGDEALVVDLPSRGLVGFESLHFVVVNDALSQVEVDLGGLSDVVAGATFFADLYGRDAYGNAYLVQTDADIQLEDGTGALSPKTVHLDASGVAVAEAFTIVRALSTDRIYVRQAGAYLGSSSVFSVVAGPVDHLAVQVPRPVLDLDEPGTVTVAAVDAYENPVPTYTTWVDLTSSSALGAGVTITTWNEGKADVVFPFDTLGIQDTLVADDGALTGESAPFDVVDFGCAFGPTASLEVGPALPLRLCIVAGSTPNTTLDLTTSSVGGEPLDFYHYALGDGTWVRSANASYDTAWTAPGAYLVEGIVVDGALCASSESGIVYAAPYDGQPVGPVDVALDAAEVDALTGILTVDVEAFDCSGDPSAGGNLIARVDMGELTGASLVETGAGIQVGLDGVGQASFQWSMLSQEAGGVATLRTGVRTGAAFGDVQVPVMGDSSHPTVFEVTPVGTSGAQFDSLDVVFSDPMQEASVSTSSVILEDPVGDTVDFDALVLSDGGRRLTATFPSRSAGDGIWTFALTQDLRKAPGALVAANPLDGEFSGASSDFLVDFGVVGDAAPDILSCDPDTTLFRPDGDATGDDPFEADAVVFAVEGSGAADWWVLEIADDHGDRVAMFHVDAGGADAVVLPWDGRGTDQRIVDNGTYEATLYAQDVHWNRGVTCTAIVAVDNVLLGVDE